MVLDYGIEEVKRRKELLSARKVFDVRDGVLDAGFREDGEKVERKETCSRRGKSKHVAGHGRVMRIQICRKIYFARTSCRVEAIVPTLVLLLLFGLPTVKRVWAEREQSGEGISQSRTKSSSRIGALC